jgi:C1A family cysteine protease
MSFRQIVVSTILAAALAGNVHDRAYYEAKFFGWMAQHGVQIESGSAFVRMIQNFADNEDYINNHNAKKASYTLAHNKFSHMDSTEWKEYVQRSGLMTKEEGEKADSVLAAPALRANLPAEIDWTTKGAVTPVKDQGQCGSCWSFSTTGAIEGAHQIKHGDLKSFSEQNLVDCDNLKNHFGRDKGCNGGLMDNAFKWIKKNGGLCSEEAYPYVSGTTKTEGTCVDVSSKCIDAAAVPDSFVDVTKNSDSAFMTALSIGPVAVAIQADEKDFQLYSGGVLTAPCGTTLDHGVLAVGYGTDAATGVDYYKVKNSWGADWGVGGYILLQRGVAQKEGQCGILSSASYPVMV